MNKTLGLAYRAKKTVLGTDTVINGLRSGNIKLIILAHDASGPTVKKIKDKAKTYQVDINDNYSSEQLSNLLNKKNVKVIGITDIGFASLLK